jgi:hypothetical protein
MRWRSKGLYWRPIKLVRAGRPESEFSKIGLANDRNIGTPGSPQKCASCRAGEEFLAKYCDPAVVTWPFRSMISLTASRIFPESPGQASRR